MQRNRTRTGFTLVEVLMVAVILAILAVIVVPQFSDASADVKTSALRSSLHTIRSQLELYKAQHNGSYPTAADWANQMTGKTDVDGTPNATSGKYGPYLQSVPPNPIDDNATIATTQDATGGWAYDAAAGTFKSNDSTVLDTDSKTKNL
jgi:general secretion pathway protein G